MFWRTEFNQIIDASRISSLSFYRAEYERGKPVAAIQSNRGRITSTLPLAVFERLYPELERIIVLEEGGPKGEILDIPARIAEIKNKIEVEEKTRK